MNEFRFCGRALETPELLESEKGSKYAHLFLRVEREYKNSDGTVDTDDFRITCFKSLAEEIEKNVKKGQTLIMKGRLQGNNFVKDNGDTIYRAELVGDKIFYVGSFTRWEHGEDEAKGFYYIGHMVD